MAPSLGGAAGDAVGWQAMGKGLQGVWVLKLIQATGLGKRCSKSSEEWRLVLWGLCFFHGSNTPHKNILPFNN